MNASLQIQAALRNGITYLSGAYTTPPLKVADITEDKKGKSLHLMIMSSSPGVLDGDEYNLKIDVGSGCSLILKTQSYQRLFTMQKGASQKLKVQVGAGASFCYLPHPTVPHSGSTFLATNKIYLSNDSTLIWGEVITCGRKLSGELFAFSKLQMVTDVFINNKLVIKENLLLEPGKMNVLSMGHWEGYTHQASLLFINSSVSVSNYIQKIIDLLNLEKDIMFGVTTAPAKGLVVRILSYKGEQLYDCLGKVEHLITRLINKSGTIHAT